MEQREAKLKTVMRRHISAPGAASREGRDGQ